MFFDIGAFELMALAVLGVLVFGPEKLPKVIQDVMGFIRKVRAFSETAKDDIRNELGPEFKDFEFEDLNPKNFVRKNLLENDDLGLKEIRNGFDLDGLADDLSPTGTGSSAGSSRGKGSGSGKSLGSGSADSSSRSAPDLRKRDRLDPGERPPFDADAT